MLAKRGEYSCNVPEMIFKTGTKNDDVIHIGESEGSEGREHSIDESLHDGWSIGETKRHQLQMIVTVHGNEGSKL